MWWMMININIQRSQALFAFFCRICAYIIRSLNITEHTVEKMMILFFKKPVKSKLKDVLKLYLYMLIPSRRFNGNSIEWLLALKRTTLQSCMRINETRHFWAATVPKTPGSSHQMWGRFIVPRPWLNYASPVAATASLSYGPNHWNDRPP